MPWRMKTLPAALTATLLCLTAIGGPRTDLGWGPDEQEVVMRYLRGRLTAGVGGSDPELPKWLSKPKPTEGILSVYFEGRKVAQAYGKGGSAVELLRNLAQRMGLALWRSPKGQDAARKGALKLDIILERSWKRLPLRLPVRDAGELGVRGVAVHEISRKEGGAAPVAYFPGLDMVRHRYESDLLRALYNEAGREPPRRWRSEVFYAYSVVEVAPKGKVYRIYRGGPLLRGARREDIREALLRVGRWIHDAQGADARFLTQYNALTRRAGQPHRVRLSRRRARRGRGAPKGRKTPYDLVEHLSAIAPLYRLYRFTWEPRVAETANRALQFGEKSVVTLDVNPPRPLTAKTAPRPIQIACIGDGRNMTRCTAMLLSAECRRAEFLHSGVTGLTRKLAKTLVQMTNKDGTLGFSPRDMLRGESPYEQQVDTPGRAVQALCRLYTLDKRRVWLAAATKIGLARLVPSSRDLGDRGPMDVIAMADLYRADAANAERFCVGAYVHGGALLARSDRDRQWLVDAARGRKVDPSLDQAKRVLYYWPSLAPYSDYEGGFANWDPPSVRSAARRLRALAAVYSVGLIREPKDLDFRNTIRKIALPIATFIMRHQFRPETQFYLPAPKIVEGAFREGPADFQVRLSTNAECIHALIDALAILSITDARSPEGAIKGPKSR